MLPFRALTLREVVRLRGHHLKGFGVATLGVYFQQLHVNRHTGGRAAHGLFENFFCLQVTPVGQVHVGFGDWIHITSGIQLAGRIHHGGSGNAGVRGVDALAATRTEEGVGLQTAFEERAVHAGALVALPQAVETEPGQQGQKCARQRNDQRVVSELVDQAWLIGQGRRNRGWRQHGSGRDRWYRFLCSRSGFCWRAFGGWCVGGSGFGGCGRRPWHSHGGAVSRRAGRCTSFGCGCRRYRGWRCGRLELGQLLDVSGQFCHAVGSVFCLPFLGNLCFWRCLSWGGFFRKCQAVWCGDSRTCVLHFSLHAAGGLSICLAHIGLWRRTGKAAAEFVEIAALGSNDLARFSRTHRRSFFGTGKVKDHAGAQAVDVVANERPRI